MVKDDLAAFQTVYGIYNKSSRCKAIKNFFGRLSRPDFYLFIFVCVAVGTFVCIVTALALLLDPKGRDTLLMTMGLISGIGVSYFYLLKKYSQMAGSAERYKDLLSDKFYQYDRYIRFKEKLDQNKGLSLAPVTALIQSKLLIAQGWGGFSCFSSRHLCFVNDYGNLFISPQRPKRKFILHFLGYIFSSSFIHDDLCLL